VKRSRDSRRSDVDRALELPVSAPRRACDRARDAELARLRHLNEHPWLAVMWAIHWSALRAWQRTRPGR